MVMFVEFTISNKQSLVPMKLPCLASSTAPGSKVITILERVRMKSGVTCHGAAAADGMVMSSMDVLSIAAWITAVQSACWMG